MSTRQQILKIIRTRESAVTTTMLRSLLDVRWSSIPVLLHDMVAKGELVRIAQCRYTTPDKADKIRSLESTGEAAQRVLRLLEREKRTRAECYAAAAEVVGEADARIVVQRLARDSLIVATNQCYSITPRGLKRVPRAAVVVQPLAPYVPPVAPPRRAGSMGFARYPSVAAGVARPYHAEGVL